MKFINRGFSLIELMVVIAIVAVLSAIAIPAYKSYVTRAKYTDVYKVLAGLAQKQIEYYNVHGAWPDSVAQIGLTPGSIAPDTTEAPTTLSEFLAPPYIMEVGIGGFMNNVGQCNRGSMVATIQPADTPFVYGSGNDFGLIIDTLDVNGVFQQTCHYAVVGSGVMADELPNCFNADDPDQLIEIDAVHAALDAQCP